MGHAAVNATTRMLPRVLSRAPRPFLSLQDHERATALAQLLACLAAASLPLSAAGTLDAGFTVTPSYLLLAVAVVAGARIVLRGWLKLPRACLAAGLVLVTVYAAGVLLGSDAQVAGVGARTSHRNVVYLADLALGLAVMGLMVGIASDRAALRRIVVWLCVGGALAAAYAVYQWVAQRYGWPLADFNNAVNSDGYSFGHRFQGVGLFGWERVRGTFKEPLFLGSYLSLTVCLTAGLALASTERARKAWVGATGVAGLALVLTVSSLAWGALALATVAVVALWAVASTRSVLAAALGALLSGMILLGPVLFYDPALLASVTGRSATSLRMTSDNRRVAWRQVEPIWSRRPVLGYGPGQSAVRLAYRPADTAGTRAPLVLGSAQGLWAASLLDAGLVGLCAWIALLASVLIFAARTLWERLEPLGMSLLVASASAVLLGNLSGDRLDVRVWVVVGLLCAAACGGRADQPAGDDQRSH